MLRRQLLLTAADYYRRSAGLLKVPEGSWQFGYQIGAIAQKLGDIYDQLGNRPEAERRYLRAIDTYFPLVGQNVTVKQSIGNALHSLGTVQWREGRHVEARATYERALTVYGDLAGPPSRSSGSQAANNVRVNAINGLGNIRMGLGNIISSGGSSRPPRSSSPRRSRSTVGRSRTNRPMPCSIPTSGSG